MRIVLSSRAEKGLRKLAKVDQIAVARKIRQLGKGKGRIGEERLLGYKGVFRVRVGNIRVVYKRTRLELFIILIQHRGEVYRLLRQLLK